MTWSTEQTPLGNYTISRRVNGDLKTVHLVRNVDELLKAVSQKGQSHGAQSPPSDRSALPDDRQSGTVRRLVTSPGLETRNILGWSIRRNNRGYLMAYKKINGKVKSVHIGTGFACAEEKIRAAAAKI